MPDGESKPLVFYVGNSLLADGSSYASAGATWGTLVTNMTFAQASGLSSYTGENYTFATPVTAVICSCT
jgi:xanthine/uracil permease